MDRQHPAVRREANVARIAALERGQDLSARSIRNDDPLIGVVAGPSRIGDPLSVRRPGGQIGVADKDATSLRPKVHDPQIGSKHIGARAPVHRISQARPVGGEGWIVAPRQSLRPSAWYGADDSDPGDRIGGIGWQKRDLPGGRPLCVLVEATAWPLESTAWHRADAGGSRPSHGNAASTATQDVQLVVPDERDPAPCRRPRDGHGEEGDVCSGIHICMYDPRPGKTDGTIWRGRELHADKG